MTIRSVVLLLVACSTSTATAEDIPKLVKTTAPAVVAIHWKEPAAVYWLRNLSTSKDDRVVLTGRPDRFGGPVGQSSQSSKDDDKTTAFANGTVVSSDGLIVAPGPSTLTEGVEEIRVSLPNGKAYEAKRVVVDRRNDLSLLKIDAEGELAYVDPIAAEVEIGAPVLSVHRDPNGMETVAAMGILAAKRPPVRPTLKRALQVDLRVGPGSSGSPILDLEGRLVGIVVALKDNNGADATIAIPGAHVEPLMKSVPVENDETVTLRRGYLGISLDSKDGQVFARSIVPDSGADKAGLRAADVILSIEGTKVSTIGETVEKVSGLGPDREIRVEIRRGDREYVLPVTLSERTIDESKPPVSVDHVLSEGIVIATQDDNKSKFYYRTLGTHPNLPKPQAIRVQRSGLDQRVEDLEKELKRLNAQINKLTEAIGQLENRSAEQDD